MRDDEKAQWEELNRRLLSAYAANDALKRALDVCGCAQLPGGSWVNNMALDRDADLFVLRAAVKKVHLWRETGASVEFTDAEQAAWLEAIK